MTSKLVTFLLAMTIVVSVGAAAPKPAPQLLPGVFSCPPRCPVVCRFGAESQVPAPG